jgi:O-acetyl-ADP-ribose deacetylase
MNRRIGNTTISLIQGNIVHESVDAIVNAANSGLVGGGGVDGAIHRAGGPSIMEECEKIRARQGGCKTGNAVATTAGKLLAKHVIHSVGPRYGNGNSGEPALLESAYRKSLDVAKELGARTVAFPSISTGVYAYPIEEAANIAITTVTNYCQKNIDAFDEIRFVLFDERTYMAFEAALPRHNDSAQ